MQAKPSSPPATTHQRLLDAAARVYGRDGIGGATTRAIAREAGVNEVTLFRHFQSKDRLLAAVVGETFGVRPAATAVPVPPATGNLRADLLQLARSYESLLIENMPLIRAMVGEIQHHGREHEKQVFRGVFRPLKEALVTRLDQARSAGKLRSDFSADLLADLFGGMLFSGVLSRTLRDIKREYSAATYLEAAVDLVLNGAAPVKRKP